ncbi:hypothetical protein RO07_21010 [Pandoraea pulmonicola]|nr:hypothetical protein RO07_21010 [Pandoraea pulmonicola]
MKGLINGNLKGQDLILNIGLDNSWFPGDQVIVTVNNQALPTHTITDAEFDADLINVPIPSAMLVDGQYNVTYHYYSPFSLTPSPESNPPLVFQVKFTPPGDPPDGENLGAPVFAEAIQASGLTSPQLTQMGDKLTANVPSYNNSREGDTIQAQVTLQSGGAAVLAQSVQVPPGGEGTAIVVTFTRAELTQVGDGLAEFAYTITDLAGNVSKLSHVAVIDLFITSFIDDLQPPEVPAFTAHKVIDEDDARKPVLVSIPPNAKLLAGDKIVLTWGTATLPEVVIQAGDLGQTPMLQIAVPYLDIAGEGNGTIPVNYEARRASGSLGSPANPLQVLVNLDQPGGPDPDPTKPYNTNLGAPTVRPSGWQPGDAENVIPLAASNADATFIVPWLTATSNTDAFQANDSVDLYYGTDKFDSFTITAQDVTAKQDIVRPLPAQVIQKYGSGAFVAQYVGSRNIPNITPQLQNSATSPPQDVTVASGASLPGGGQPLPPASFDVPADNPYITYDRAKAGVKIIVPTYVNIAVGDTVIIEFTAKWGAKGTGPDIDLAKYTSPASTVGPDNVTNGLSFTLPPDNALYLYPFCVAYVTYTATNKTGSVTSPSTSVSCDERANPSPPADPKRPNPPIR